MAAESIRRRLPWGSRPRKAGPRSWTIEFPFDTVHAMIKHVRTLSIVMYVNAGIALVVAAIAAFAGTAIFRMNPADWVADGSAPEGQLFGTGMYAAVGAYCGITAVLQIIAATKLRKFRGRTLAMAALAAGAFNTPVCCCLPLFSLPAALFGGWVLLDQGVREAFLIAERNNWSADQVLAYYAGGGQGMGGAPPPAAPPGFPPGGAPPPRPSGGPPPPRSL